MAKSRILYSNNARTSLAGPITTSDTSLTVVSAAAFPTISNATQSFRITLDDGVGLEIMKVTAVSGVTLTVVRAQEGTAPRAFASTTKVECRLTAQSISDFARREDRLEDFASIENLPDPSTVNPNSAMCASTDANGNPIIATNNGTKWAFVNYPDRIKVGPAGAGATTTSINYTNASLILLDTVSRSYVVQITSGPNIGLCRFITTIASGSFSWATALPSAPGVSDTYEIYRCVSTLSYPKGGGSDKVFAENDANVWTSYTIPAGKNASSAGPVTINSGVTVTVSSGSVWSIV